MEKTNDKAAVSDALQDPRVREVCDKLDHTFIKIDEPTRLDDFLKAVEDTVIYGFRSIAVCGNLVPTIKKHYPNLRVSAALSFPLGADTTAAKVFAVQDMLEYGADDIDIVLDLFAIKTHNWGKTGEEVAAIAREVGRAGRIFKAITEAPILTDEEIRKVGQILVDNGADFFKTCTGYGRPATTPALVAKIRGYVGTRIQVKASGGIRTLAEFRGVVDAGADVVGSSSSPAIISELVKKLDGSS
jgi:deoxyribose-phosphate aldolase